MNANTAERLTPAPDPQEQLRLSYERRATARAAVDRAVAATNRGRASHAAANEEHRRRLALKLEWKARRNEAQRKWSEAGHEGSPPMAVIDPKAESGLLNAELDVDTTATALAALEAAETRARTALAVAERAVVAVADQILGGDVEQLASQVLRLSNEILAVDRKLRAARPDGLNTPLGQLHAPLTGSATVERALECARRLREFDEINTPLDQLRGLTANNQRELDELRERRAALIAGPTEE